MTTVFFFASICSLMLTANANLCNITQFQCQNGSQCIDLLQKCDNTYNCNDTSDESNLFAGCVPPKSISFTLIPLYCGFIIRFDNSTDVKKLTRIGIMIQGPQYYREINVTSLDELTLQNDPNILPATAYNVSVTSFNLIGSSGTVTQVVITPKPPPAVQNIVQLTSDSLYNRIVASWDNVTGNLTGTCVITYIAEAKCGNKTIKQMVNTTMAIFDQTHNTTGQINCTASVVAQNLVANSTITNQIIQTVALGVPSEPQNITISNIAGWESGNKSISWSYPKDLGNARPDEISYIVRWCIVKATNLTTICNDSGKISATMFNVGGLQSGQEYNFTVKAANLEKVTGNPANPIFSNTSLTDAVPTSPRNLTAAKDQKNPQTTVLLSWEHPVTIPGLTAKDIKYIITVSAPATPSKQLIKTPPGANTSLIAILNPSTVYTIKLQAFSARGDTYGKEASVTHTTDDEKFAGWKIAVIVIFVLLIVSLIIRKGVRVYLKRKNQKLLISKNEQTPDKQGNQEEVNDQKNQTYEDETA